jgi:hypothetical protein
MAQLGLGLEPHARGPQPPVPLDIDLAGAVDHHLVDGRVGEQRLERPQAGRGQQHALAQRDTLGLRQRRTLTFDQGGDLGADVGAAIAPPRPLDQPLTQRPGQFLDRLHPFQKGARGATRPPRVRTRPM